jgi:hypothetical protein
MHDDVWYTGLFKMIVRVLTTCHTQHTSDSSICIFLFNRTTLQVFVTYRTGALYVHFLWFYKHQHDNRVHSTQNAFSQPFASILVNCAPSGEMRNYCTPHIIKENSDNFLIHRCNYILLSQVYCVWQVVKTQTFILNNPVIKLPYVSAYKAFEVCNADQSDIWWRIQPLNTNCISSVTDSL